MKNKKPVMRREDGRLLWIQLINHLYCKDDFINGEFSWDEFLQYRNHGHKDSHPLTF